MGQDNELSELISDFDAKYKSRITDATQKISDKGEPIICDIEGAHLIFEKEGKLTLYKDLPRQNRLEPASRRNPIIDPMIVINDPTEVYPLIENYVIDAVEYGRSSMGGCVSAIEKYCNR